MKDKYVMYWHKNADASLILSFTKPDRHYLAETVSSIGIPLSKVVTYDYNNKSVSEIVPESEIGDINKIEKMMVNLS